MIECVKIMAKKKIKTGSQSDAPTFVQERKNLIKRLLGHKENFEIDWIVESFLTKKLFKSYPPEFWETFYPPFEMPTLKVLFSAWGKNYVATEYNKFLFLSSRAESPAAQSSEKIGADYQVKPKSATNLKDFLK